MTDIKKPAAARGARKKTSKKAEPTEKEPRRSARAAPIEEEDAPEAEADYGDRGDDDESEVAPVTRYAPPPVRGSRETEPRGHGEEPRKADDDLDDEDDLPPARSAEREPTRQVSPRAEGPDRGGDRERDRDRDRPASRQAEPGGRRDRGDRDRGREKDGPGPSPQAASGKAKLSDEYLLQVSFDKQQRNFYATYLEFPEIKALNGSREAAMRDVENRLETHLQNLRRKNSPLPDTFQSKRYPERVEVRLSQTLQRRLDQLSRHEKVSVEQLISDLLMASTVEKKPEPAHRPPQGQSGRHEGRHGGGQQSGNRQQQHNHGSNNRRQPNARNFHDTMDNRENFMEYVRNLEKGNFRKK